MTRYCTCPCSTGRYRAVNIRWYPSEILASFNPSAVANRLIELVKGRVPVLMCFDRPGSARVCALLDAINGGRPD